MEERSYDPAELAYKQEQGTISPEEQVWFERWYTGFNDEEVLLSSSKHTTPEQIRDRIFSRVSTQMDAPAKAERRIIPLWRKLAAAAAIFLIIGFAALYNNTLLNLVNPAPQIELSSNKAQHRHIKLPDGSQVWLSPDTRISYPEHFSSAQRVVKLEGEAFFEVVHEAKHPFIIQSGNLKTVVLGTSFNVNAYTKNASAEITVVTGKVGVLLAGKQQITIGNQRTIYNRATGTLTKENYPDAAKFLDQRNGLFDFKGASLAEVSRVLEQQYGVRVLIAPELAGKAFYGHLNMTDPAQKTFNKLCTVMETKWTSENGAYHIHQISTHQTPQ